MQPDQPAEAGGDIRVAIVAADPSRRELLTAALAAVAGLVVVAWAESVELLLVLGTHAAVCLCAIAPTADEVARLAGLGCVVAVDDGDPVAAVRAAAQRGTGPPQVRRPRLAPRQREVLITYVSSSDLLPTIARRLGMDHETLKTHLRRIRAKYSEVGRPAPTRRDLYVRAVEDGLLRPPTDPWS